MRTSRKISPRSRKTHSDEDPLAGDLSHLFKTADWQVAKFELTKPKNKVVTLRMSEELLSEVKREAKRTGLDYQRYIRLALENTIRKKAV